MSISNQLPTQYQQFIHLSRYSRWLEGEGRRETWSETVSRYFNFFESHLEEMCGYKLEPKVKDELEEAIIATRVMPSMRCLMTAGEALKRENISGYNCSYVAVNRVALVNIWCMSLSWASRNSFHALNPEDA